MAKRKTLAEELLELIFTLLFAGIIALLGGGGKRKSTSSSKVSQSIGSKTIKSTTKPRSQNEKTLLEKNLAKKQQAEAASRRMKALNEQWAKERKEESIARQQKQVHIVIPHEQVVLSVKQPENQKEQNVTQSDSPEIRMVNQQKAIISKLTLDVQELRNQNQELQNSLQNLESIVIEKQRPKSARKQDNITALLSMESRIIKLENDLHCLGYEFFQSFLK
jgi:hypothetical protein